MGSEFIGLAIGVRLGAGLTRQVMHFLRYGTVSITLMACVVFTAAGYSSRPSGDGFDEAGSFLMDETGFAQRVTSELAISDEQRGHIFDGVMRISDAPIAHMPTPEIAASLPEDVPMQDLPAGVTRDIPLAQGYKFVKFDDRILIINPSNRFVVAMIPRYKLVP